MAITDTNDIGLFQRIAETVKQAPNAVVKDNLVTGGKNITAYGLTLTEHAGHSFGTSPFLRIAGEKTFLVMHTLNEGTDNEITWIKGTDVRPKLEQMAAKLEAA